LGALPGAVPAQMSGGRTKRIRIETYAIVYATLFFLRRKPGSLSRFT